MSTIEKEESPEDRGHRLFVAVSSSLWHTPSAVINSTKIYAIRMARLNNHWSDSTLISAIKGYAGA